MDQHENTTAITHAGEIPADLREHIQAPIDPFPGYRQRLVTDAEGNVPSGFGFDMLRQVFESQAYFQGLLGHDYNNMSTPEKIEYLKGQIMALQAETIEALDEMSWKPWTHGEKKINAEAMLGECADILCFLVNIVLGLGFTSEDFYRYHQEKALRNIKRQEDKYDGQADKCPGCRRDINDLRAKNLPVGNFGGVDYCSHECIQKVNPGLVKGTGLPFHNTDTSES